MKLIVRFLFLTAFVATSVFGQATTETNSERQKKIDALLNSLHYEHGDVIVGSGLATLKIPETFNYLNADDTEKILTQLWGNPPGEKRLGMLLPADISPASNESWGVIISYVSDGFVKDDDAAKIDYNDLLKDMKKATADSSAERIKEGYPGIELVGWAAPPRYDSTAKKLYWAKEIKFSDTSATTLNYDIRVLGRHGVLSLNCVAAMQQLPEIEKRTPEILGMVNFNQGHRYADFVPSTDKVAAYGVGALVAGGLLAKAGFFKVLLVGLLAAKKFVIIGAVALFSFIKRLFGKKNVS